MVGEVAVFGASGMLGSAVLDRLDDMYHVLNPTHEECDLTSLESCDSFFDWNSPDTVVMCAGKVGGIKANMEDPLGFLNENLMMTMNVVNSCVKNDVETFINVASSCMYPRECLQPMKEEYLLGGNLEPTNEGYALAKLVGVKLTEYYRKQKNLNYISIIPCNLYGPEDNWTESGHVMAALIKNINEAAAEGRSKLTIRGSGKAKREFLHTEDAAYGIAYILDMMHTDPHLLKKWNYINLGSGEDYSIKRLAAKICRAIDYEPEFEFDRTFPDGMPRKVLNIDRISSLGWKPQIHIDDGISEMIGYAS